MYSRVIITAVVGLVIFGLSSGFCAQDSDFMRNNDSGDNKLIQVLQQPDKASPIQKREADPNEDDSDDGDDADHIIGKRLTQGHAAVTTDDMGFKSRPGFRSWGGKRSKFATWGGKRSKFNNWGGKRSGDGAPVDPDELARAVALLRGDLDDAGSEKWKKDKFRSWGGKRFDLGKREMESPLLYEQTNTDEDDYVDIGKRGEFRSWGGKRSDSPQEDFLRLKSGGGEWIDQGDDRTDEVRRLNMILQRYYLNSILQNMLQKDLRIGKKNEHHDKQFNPWKGKR